MPDLRAGIEGRMHKGRLMRVTRRLFLALPALPWLIAAPAHGDAARNVTSPVRGLRLLMVERRGCVWCRRFDREIAPGYDAHPQGAAAPLARIDLDGPWPDGLALARRPSLTPSFILLRDGIELGRIEGYVGQRHFWPALSEMMQRAGVLSAPIAIPPRG